MAAKAARRKHATEARQMTFVITQPCIDVQDQSCVEVCPVDCIHFEDGADRMLYIEPEVCIDCGACEPACPVTAIYEESDLPSEQVQFTEINALWFSDTAAARAKVTDIPALEGATATATENDAAISEEITASTAVDTDPVAESTPEAPAATADEEPSRGAYKYGDSGNVEGKCALCGSYVIKGGTMFRNKSVLCPDCAVKAERIRDPFRQRSGAR